MKIKITAYLLAALVFAAVMINSLVLTYNIDKIYGSVISAPDNLSGGEIYREAYEDFKRRERYISLTVSHSDITDIRNDFAEILGAIDADDEDSLLIAKSRLKESLLHLRRLCSINFDSIF